jgi:hypothetical protein
MALHVSWRFPNRFELGIFVIGILALMAFDYAQNAYQVPGAKFSDPSFLFGIQLITLFWIGFAIYVVALLTGVIRALLRRTTHVYLDLFFGIIMTVGLYFLTAGGIWAHYYAPDAAIPYFFNIAQIDMYHIFGIFTQVFGAVWFFVSD